jgi:hypothetical protein
VPTKWKNLRVEKFEFRVGFEIGPAFADGRELTLGELADRLEEMAKHLDGKPLEGLLAHLAEHIRYPTQGMSDEEKLQYYDASAPKTLASTYYPCGSCPGMSNARWCSDSSGTVVCEEC